MNDEYNSSAPMVPQVAANVSDAPQLSDTQMRDLVKKCTTQWSTDGSGNIFWASGPVVEGVEPGLYRIQVSDRVGVHLVKQRISTDTLINITSSDSEKVIREISRFWGLKSKFLERGLLHKRGILMSGDPGSGKTCTIQLLIQNIIQRKGLAIYPHPNPHITSEGLQMIRKIQPDIPICLVLEDFEVLIQRNENENEWLSILDGESQVDNIVFLATTNYISRLDKRFTDRPSRFDTVMTVKMPNKEMRRQYLLAKEPSVTPDELELWVEYTKGLSIAHLKEFIILVKMYDHTPIQAKDKLRKMRARDYSENDNLEGTDYAKQPLGFSAGNMGKD